VDWGPVLLAGAGLGFEAFIFWRSRWLSSLFALVSLFEAADALAGDLCEDGMADFGVRGLVADWTGSEADLAADE